MYNFICQLVPKENVQEVPGASQAGINFCHNVINAVQPNNVLALQLISDKKKRKFKFDNQNIKIIQKRWFKHKSLGKIINSIIENLTLTKTLYKTKKSIWFYNINKHTFIAYFLLRYILNKKCYVIFADFNPNLKSNKIALRFIKKSNGIIALSSNSKSLFPNHPNLHVLSGIINKEKTPLTNDTINKNDILFAGSLEGHAGINLAIDTFKDLSHLNLLITGFAKPHIIDKIKPYQNIKYLGYLTYTDYLKVLQKVDIVLSLRNPDYKENLYNFPSKIIEFFINRKIVISTIQYSTINKAALFNCNYNKSDLSKLIEKIFEKKDSELKKIQDLSYDYAIDEFSEENWISLVKKVESNCL